MADAWSVAFFVRGVGSGFRKGRWYRIWVTQEAIFFADVGSAESPRAPLKVGLAGLVGAAIIHSERVAFARGLKEVQSVRSEDLALDGKDTFRAVREDFEWSGLRHRGGRKVIEWMVQLREQGHIRFEFPTVKEWDEARPALRAWFTSDFDGGVTWNDEQKKFVPSAL
jgi:hypothetical protein